MHRPCRDQMATREFCFESPCLCFAFENLRRVHLQQVLILQSIAVDDMLLISQISEVQIPHPIFWLPVDILESFFFSL